MAERKTFTFRKEWREAIATLSKRERQAVYEAIIDYGITGNYSELTPNETLAFSFVKAAIDVDIERSKEVSMRRAEAGRKGGAPKGNDNAKRKSGTRDMPLPVKTEKPAIVTTGDNAKFEKWIKDKCPYIHSHIPMMKDEEFGKLKATYG